jgi:hypothetical protein
MEGLGEILILMAAATVMIIVVGRMSQGSAAVKKELAAMETVKTELAALRSREGRRDSPPVHLSIHHLLSDRELLRPRGGGNVDMVLDAADLPPTLADYLEEVRAAGAKARILILDPSSSLTERHRFVQQAEGDPTAAAQHVRAKAHKAIAELAPLATIRLFDAVPPGNLIIVDDHIFWGGIPSVPSDASYPIIGITADTRADVYWAFRRNFDVLWKQAKPVAPPKPAASHLTAASL